MVDTSFKAGVLRIGSRGSALALAQCELLRAQLSGQACEVVSIATSGDKKRYAGAGVARDKLDWIAEIQQALLEGAIDLALHSGKDVPIEVAPTTRLIPVLRRASAADVCILGPELSRTGIERIAEMPAGTRFGTSSKRRAAQLLHSNSALRVEPLRGNVPTRIARLQQPGGPQALVLAAAGIERLALVPESSFRLALDEFVPAVNQGLLVAQIRDSDTELEALLKQASPPESRRAFALERAVVQALGADCDSALGVYADFDDRGEVVLRAQVCARDGSRTVSSWHKGSSEESEDELLSTRVIKELREQGAVELLHGESLDGELLHPKRS